MLTVKQRQMNLNFLNYSTGGIDGIEGPKTKQGYKDFQSDNFLKVDGIYGQETEECLIKTIKEIQNIIGAKIDGVAGDETKEKTKIYQAENGLIIDGFAGVDTRNKMFLQGWNSIKHFKKEEFTCKCGCKLNNINLNVVKIADEIREYFGNEAIVTSGTRCEKHNKEVGGVANSRHLTGKAIDIYIRNVNGNDLLKEAKKYVNGGRLRYTYLISGTNAIHIDIL